MEALVAVGLASNILQFVDSACKLASTFNEIRKSSDGVTKQAEYLRKQAEQVKRGVSEALKLLPEDQDPGFHQYAKDLMTAIDDYLIELDKVTTKNPKSRTESFKVAVKTWRKKEYLQELATNIERMGAQVRRHIEGVWLPRLDSKLDTLLENDKKLEELSDGMNRLCLQVRNTASDTEAHTITAVDAWYSKIERVKVRQKCLQALFFPQLERREDQIREAHKKTFRWILDTDDHGCTNSGEEDVDDSDQESHVTYKEMQQRSRFRNWLASDDCNSNVFWISGKPGSGKSTLMKFLVHHPALRTRLGAWTVDQGFDLIIADYYFWRLGLPLQRSLTGLVRSLLWQILKARPSLIDIAFESDATWMSGGQGFQFTFTELRHAMQRILAAAVGLKIRLLLFIDGLDEFDDRDELSGTGPLRDERDLVDFLHMFYRQPAVKLCVSSRPIVTFEHEFGNDDDYEFDIHSRHFYIHHLTRNDIRVFVRQNLGHDKLFRELCKSDERHKDLVKEIVEQARGVFIWIYLTCRLLLRGISYHDNISDLQEKLRRLPSELNDSYKMMLSHEDPVYERRVARLLIAHPAMLKLGVSLTTMVAEFIWSDPSEHCQLLDLDRISLDYLALRERQISKRLSAYCNGLLEKRRQTKWPYDWKTDKVSVFENPVDYSHRTVGDFLQISDIQNDLLKRSGTTIARTLLSAVDGWLALSRAITILTSQPCPITSQMSYYSSESMTSAEYFGSLTEFLLRVFESILKVAKSPELSDHEELYPRMLGLEALLLQDLFGTYNATGQWLGQYTKGIPRPAVKELIFDKYHTHGRRLSDPVKKPITWSPLGCMISLKCSPHFLHKRLAQDNCLLDPSEDIVPELWICLDDHGENRDIPELCQILFEYGADPNGLFRGSTPWKYFLDEALERWWPWPDTAMSARTDELIEKLRQIGLWLNYGADVTAVCEIVASIRIDHGRHQGQGFFRVIRSIEPSGSWKSVGAKRIQEIRSGSVLGRKIVSLSAHNIVSYMVRKSIEAGVEIPFDKELLRGMNDDECEDVEETLARTCKELEANYRKT